MNIGAKDPLDKSTHFPQHHGNFNDEKALLIGTELYVKYALKYLQIENRRYPQGNVG